MKCKRCDQPIKPSEDDGHGGHLSPEYCIAALMGRVEELGGQLNEALDRLEQSVKSGEELLDAVENVKKALVPFSVLVVHADGTQEKVGEVPEIVNGKCSILCPFVPKNTNVGTCRIDFDDVRCEEWQSPKPGPRCPRGKKETNNG